MALAPIRTILQGNPISPSHQPPPDEFASYLEDKEARLLAIEAEALPDRVETLEEGQIGGYVAAATWTGLLAITPSVNGTAGEVQDSDTGTHSAASGTGYDGATVNNAGRYSWNGSWGRWVRIGDTGLSGKLTSAANLSDVADAATALGNLGAAAQAEFEAEQQARAAVTRDMAWKAGRGR